MPLSALPLPSALGGEGKGERDGNGAGGETGVSIARPDLPTSPRPSRPLAAEGATVK
jgi:hypothetical protein